MKKLFAAFSVSLIAWANIASADITVSLMGTGQFSETFSTFTTNTQDATTFRVIGNDASAIYGDLPSTVDITGNTFQLKLTATYAGTASSIFQIDLFDTNGDDRLYQGSYTSFTQNVPTTVTLSFFSQPGAFNNNVVSFGLLGGGSNSGSVDLKMDTLLAVPEPSTYALMAVGLAFLLSRAFYRKLPSLV